MKCWSATNYVLKNALRILYATVATTTLILAFILPTIYPYFPVSIFLSLLYHFLFTLNFIFTLTSCMPYLLHSELLLCWSFLPSCVFCHFLSSLLLFSSCLRSPSLPLPLAHPSWLGCFVLCCHSYFKLIASSKKQDLTHRLCTNDDSLTLFRCICSAFSFLGVNIWWRRRYKTEAKSYVHHWELRKRARELGENGCKCSLTTKIKWRMRKGKRAKLHIEIIV